MKKLLLIYNPNAGKGKIRAKLSEVVETLTKFGWLVTVKPTSTKSEATIIASRLGDKFDRIICCGGDGTLSETAAGLLKVSNPPPIGYIPAGSTNDCATSLDIPSDIVSAAEVVGKTGTEHNWDIGTLNGKSFIYIAAFGAFTSVAYGTPQELKQRFGHLAYIMGGVASLPTVKAYKMRIEHDDGVIEDDFYYGMVCNTISVGGIKQMPTIKVSLDDGLFEVVLVRRPTNFMQILDTLGAFIRQEPSDEMGLYVLRTSKLKITAKEPIPWTIDGEFGGKHLDVEILVKPHMLKVIRGK